MSLSRWSSLSSSLSSNAQGWVCGYKRWTMFSTVCNGRLSNQDARLIKWSGNLRIGDKQRLLTAKYCQGSLAFEKNYSVLMGMGWSTCLGSRSPEGRAGWSLPLKYFRRSLLNWRISAQVHEYTTSTFIQEATVLSIVSARGHIVSSLLHVSGRTARWFLWLLWPIKGGSGRFPSVDKSGRAHSRR